MKAKNLIQKILIILFIFSSVPIQAQTRVGVFLTYGDHQENLGIGALGEFFLTDQISIAPNVIYFFPKDDTEFLSEDHWVDLNLNGNYYFPTGGTVVPYVLAGLNYSMRKYEFDGGGSEDANTLGFNLGGGADFDFDSSFIPFAQVRYAISDSGQLVIPAGVKIELSE